MATLYWGGGTGTWDGFTTTNWYTDLARTVLSTRAPSAEDDVVFDSTSNATGYTVTISNNTSVCRDLTISGPASGNVTVAGTGTLAIFGSLTLSATGITRTYTGQITFRATSSGKTINTNGVTLGNIALNGVGGEWTLGAAISCGGVDIGNGTFNTANYSLTCTNFNTSATGSHTINLGSSSVSNSGNLNLTSGTTFNAGTSTITMSSSGALLGIAGVAGFTYYNVTFSASVVTQISLNGTNTFNNLTFTTPSGGLIVPVALSGNQTITGTLTATGSGAINRLFFRSSVVGTARTMTVAAVGTLTDVDFRDITVAGASSPWSGTRLGNCGGNTNITFGAGVNKYWNLPAGGAWTAAAWATGSGGTVDVLNFPLAQDTAIIEDTGLNASASITGFSGYNLNTLDCSTRTNAATISGSSPIIYGNLTLSTAMTVSSLTSIAFQGRATQTITSAGRTMSAITINTASSSVILADALTGLSVGLISGTFDTNSKNVTLTGAIQPFSTSTAVTLTFGSSVISCTTFGSSSVVVTLTVNAGTSTINATGSIGFVGTSPTYYNVTVTGQSGNIYGTNTFNNLTFTSPTSTGVNGFVVYGNQTINGTLALAGGTSVTQRLTFISDTPGTQRTLTAATVTGLSDIDFRDIKGAGAGTWTGGTRIGDCGGNSGIGFTAAKTVYWNLAGTNNWSDTGWATTSTGSPAANNFPLAQDTATFTDAGSAGTVTLNTGWNIGTIDASGRTSAMTLAGGGGVNIYGNVTYGSGITSTANGAWQFRGTSTQTFTTAGKSLGNSITISNPSCAFRHGDAYTSSAGLGLLSGTYTTQNYNISCSSFDSSVPAGTTRSVTFGTSTVTITGTVFNFSASTGLTFSGASSTINMSSTSAKNFNGGSLTYGTLSSTGGTTNALTISGSNTFTTLTNTARTYLIFTFNTTQTITNFTYSGASGSVVRWYSSSAGLRATLNTSSSAVGANSVDGGNNSGLTFTGTSPDYFYVKDIALIGATAGGTGKFFLMF